jgi:hypothetical protein
MFSGIVQIIRVRANSREMRFATLTAHLTVVKLVHFATLTIVKISRRIAKFS